MREVPIVWGVRAGAKKPSTNFYLKKNHFCFGRIEELNQTKNPEEQRIVHGWSRSSFNIIDDPLETEIKMKVRSGGGAR